jgi:hypothetical protein
MMDWRWYIPHALAGGAILGAVLAAVLIPINRRRDVRRRRKEIASAAARLTTASPLHGPGEPYVVHRKWPSLQRLWKGYYVTG